MVTARKPQYCCKCQVRAVWEKHPTLCWWCLGKPGAKKLRVKK